MDIYSDYIPFNVSMTLYYNFSLKLAVCFFLLSLSGCVTRQRYLDYGRDCRDNGERVGIAKAQSEIIDLSSRLSRANYELEQCRKTKKR